MKFKSLLAAGAAIFLSLSASALITGWDEIDGMNWSYEINGSDVAFRSGSNLYGTKITVPEGLQPYHGAVSVRTLKAELFYKLSTLTTVIVPATVDTIEAGAFKDCAKLTSITLPLKFKNVLTKTSPQFVNCNKNLRLTFKDVSSPICTASFVAYPEEGDEVFTNSYVTKGSKLGAVPELDVKYWYVSLQPNGWYTKATGGTKVTANTVVKDNVTYYLHWTARKYPVTAAPYLTSAPEGGERAGSVTGSGMYLPGKKVTLRATAKNGYTFIDWSYNGQLQGLSNTTFSFLMGYIDTNIKAYFAENALVQNALSLWVLDGGSPVDFDDWMDGGMMLHVGEKFDMEIAPLMQYQFESLNSSLTVTASGLPAGLKLVNDKKLGAWYIRGKATTASKKDKNGQYVPSTVKLTVKCGKVSKVFTSNWMVFPLPEHVVGTYFGGFEPEPKSGIGPFTPDEAGTITISVTSAGKITGKWEDNLGTYTITADGFETVAEDDQSPTVCNSVTIKRVSKTLGNSTTTNATITITAPQYKTLYDNADKLSLDFVLPAPANGGETIVWDGVIHLYKNIWKTDPVAKGIGGVMYGSGYGGIVDYFYKGEAYTMHLSYTEDKGGFLTTKCTVTKNGKTVYTTSVKNPICIPDGWCFVYLKANAAKKFPGYYDAWDSPGMLDHYLDLYLNPEN